MALCRRRPPLLLLRKRAPLFWPQTARYCRRLPVDSVSTRPHWVTPIPKIAALAQQPAMTSDFRNTRMRSASIRPYSCLFLLYSSKRSTARGFSSYNDAPGNRAVASITYVSVRAVANFASLIMIQTNTGNQCYQSHCLAPLRQPIGVGIVRLLALSTCGANAGACLCVTAVEHSAAGERLSGWTTLPLMALRRSAT